jgi:hypothetical protein
MPDLAAPAQRHEVMANLLRHYLPFQGLRYGSRLAGTTFGGQHLTNRLDQQKQCVSDS